MSLDQSDLSQILETAIVAARRGGQRALEESHALKISVKNGTELVTQADGQCQQLIVDCIKETYPDHGFIGEEGRHGKIFKQPPRGESAFWWVIDPIDGTSNYARGMRAFTVSIAALFEGRPIVGVVFEPATDAIYTAVQGGEAQLNGRHIVAADDDIGPFTCVGLDSHFDDKDLPWVNEIIKQSRFRNFGTTALQMAYVAQGGLVATVVCTPKLWDIAAGALLADAAGAVTTDWQGQTIFPVDLDNYEGQAYQVVTANTKVHARLMAMMRG